MKIVLIASLVSLAAFGNAIAASITNTDGSDAVITIAEDGNKIEMTIAAGATEEICPSGCFITTPNGDRVALTGGETVEISKGSATVK